MNPQKVLNSISKRFIFFSITISFCFLITVLWNTQKIIEADTYKYSKYFLEETSQIIKHQYSEKIKLTLQAHVDMSRLPDYIYSIQEHETILTDNPILKLSKKNETVSTPSVYILSKAPNYSDTLNFSHFLIPKKEDYLSIVRIQKIEKESGKAKVTTFDVDSHWLFSITNDQTTLSSFSYFITGLENQIVFQTPSTLNTYSMRDRISDAENFSVNAELDDGPFQVTVSPNDSFYRLRKKQFELSYYLFSGIAGILFILAFTYSVYFLISKPLHELNLTLHRWLNTKFGVKFPTLNRNDEFGEISRAMNTLLEGRISTYIQKQLTFEKENFLQNVPSSLGNSSIRFSKLKPELKEKLNTGQHFKSFCLSVQLTELEGIAIYLRNGKISPELFSKELSNYIQKVQKTVHKSKGVFDSFDGSSFLVLWGISEKQKRDSFLALNIQSVIDEIRERTKQLEMRLNEILAKSLLETNSEENERNDDLIPQVGIFLEMGLHYGNLFISKISTETNDFNDFIFQGDCIPTAQRVKGFCIDLGTDCLVSGAAAEQLSEWLDENTSLYQLVHADDFTPDIYELRNKVELNNVIPFEEANKEQISLAPSNKEFVENETSPEDSQQSEPIAA